MLCRTLGNNPCQMLTITDELSTYLTSEQEAQLFKTHADNKIMSKDKPYAKCMEE